jgi:proline iminopeptidase
MIPIETPKGTFHVWTKRVGNNPKIKVLLLHGGPGMTHEYLEAFDSYFPGQGIEYYYYDQLGRPTAISQRTRTCGCCRGSSKKSSRSARRSGSGPTTSTCTDIPGAAARDRVCAQVSAEPEGARDLEHGHEHPEYNEYAKKVLMPQMDQQALAEIQALEARKDYSNPRYEELLMQHFYVDHILRMPADAWPEPVLRSLGHLNHDIYVLMQGPSELGSSGLLDQWTRTADLPRITVPTLVVGARYDTMDPRHMQMMASKVRHGRYLYCPNGGHFDLYDDQKSLLRRATLVHTRRRCRPFLTKHAAGATCHHAPRCLTRRVRTPNV